jgi:hypothetical protein
MTTDLTIIEAGVWTITPETPVEQVADVLGKIEWMIRRAKEVKDELECRMVEKIQTTGEDIVIGDCRYYVGVAKTVKCIDPKTTLEEILTTSGGDVGKVIDCLSSKAFKYGTVRRFFEEAGQFQTYGRLFETVEADELKTGKPTRRLQKVNEAFVK